MREAIIVTVGWREIFNPTNPGVSPQGRRKGSVPLTARIDEVLRKLDPDAVPSSNPRG